MNLAVGRILSINIARESEAQTWSGSGLRTGIRKLPVEGLVQFGDDALAGDTVVDREHHGGYHQAVYAYAREDAIWWEEKIGRDIAPGQFGENLTIEEIDVTNAVIGERWQIGDLLLEVSGPRIPCRVFSGFWDRPSLIKEFTEANRPGAYLRIIEEAMVERGTRIEVISRPDHGITIADFFAAKSGERSKIHQIAQVQDLAEKDLDWARRIASSN